MTEFNLTKQIIAERVNKARLDDFQSIIPQFISFGKLKIKAMTSYLVPMAHNH